MTPTARRQEIATTAALHRWLYVDPHTGRELSQQDRERVREMEKAGRVVPKKKDQQWIGCNRQI